MAWRNKEFQQLKSSGNCPQCRAKIDPTAKKCPHCQSFLDRRRYLSLGNTYLALILALITVFSFLIPAIKKNFIPPNAELHIEIVGTKVDTTSGRYIPRLEVLASNIGDYTATVVKNTIDLRIDPTLVLHLDSHSNFDYKELVIKPGENIGFDIIPTKFASAGQLDLETDKATVFYSIDQLDFSNLYPGDNVIYFSTTIDYVGYKGKKSHSMAQSDALIEKEFSLLACALRNRLFLK